MRLLESIQSNETNTVILYSLERLSRDMLTLLALERLLDEFEIKLHTVEGEVNTETPDGFMNFAMKAFLGEMERRQVKYRTSKAMEYMKTQGRVTGQIPYGYTRQGDNLQENPQEMEIIRRINQLYSEGRNLTDISGELERSGVRTRKGTNFSIQQVKRLIGNYEDVKKKKASRFANSITDFIRAIA
jgi:site-specific DNA recombinase